MTKYVLPALLLLAACPGPKMPSGPPPEYEEPPRPSWLDGGSPPAPPPSSAPPPLAPEGPIVDAGAG